MFFIKLCPVIKKVHLYFIIDDTQIVIDSHDSDSTYILYFYISNNSISMTYYYY